MDAALNSQFPDLEVSVLTGYRDFEYAKEAIRLGVTRFLLKPSNMDELEEAIECMCANLNLAHFSRVQKAGRSIGERIPQSGTWKISQKAL